ncbi:hypothetical protein R4K92_06350 [Brachyspira intermedia]|uniref:hypothetical protein n=1 Tax=Brachyspira intermedia TaxID=84377 RepID=UPI003004AE25
MKKNIINITAISLLIMSIISCTANTKPNIYHSLITIKSKSYTRKPMSIYVSKTTENNYELMGIITTDKYSEEYDTGKDSYNISFYLDGGVYDIKFMWYEYKTVYPNPPYKDYKEYILQGKQIEKGINYKIDIDELIK